MARIWRGSRCRSSPCSNKGPDGVIRLSWASELLFMPTEPRLDPRHVGTVEPMWTLLDLTPRGRPDAYEQIEYGCYRTEVPANTRQEL